MIVFCFVSLLPSLTTDLLLSPTHLLPVAQKRSLLRTPFMLSAPSFSSAAFFSFLFLGVSITAALQQTNKACSLPTGRKVEEEGRGGGGGGGGGEGAPLLHHHEIAFSPPSHGSLHFVFFLIDYKGSEEDKESRRRRRKEERPSSLEKTEGRLLLFLRPSPSPFVFAS